MVANDTHDGVEKPVYPCGLIANSIFNDTYGKLTGLDGNLGTVYEFSKSGIAWPTDKNKYGATKYTAADVVPPPNWARFNGTYNGFDLANLDLANDEPFMVWMRTAGLPTFRKLWGRIDDPAGIKKGKYLIRVGLRTCSSPHMNTRLCNIFFFAIIWLPLSASFIGVLACATSSFAIIWLPSLSLPLSLLCHRSPFFMTIASFTAISPLRLFFYAFRVPLAHSLSSSYRL